MSIVVIIHLFFLKGSSCFIRCFGGQVLKVYVVGTQCLKWWSPFIIVPCHLWPITHWKDHAIEKANMCSHSRGGTIQKKLDQECVHIHKVYKMIYVMFLTEKNWISNWKNFLLLYFTPCYQITTTNVIPLPIFHIENGNSRCLDVANLIGFISNNGEKCFMVTCNSTFANCYSPLQTVTILC